MLAGGVADGAPSVHRVLGQGLDGSLKVITLQQQRGGFGLSIACCQHK